MASKTYAELRDELAETQRTFLETELSLVVTFADLAKQRYEHGDSQDGDRCKGQAETAIKTVRHFIATTDLLGSATFDLLAKRCDQVERIVATLKPAK
jgi:hypothetical protein